MAEKFLNTKNKKIFATVALAITGWHAMIMGANPLKLPPQPGLISTPLIGGVSLLTVAGFITIIAIYLILTEY